MEWEILLWLLSLLVHLGLLAIVFHELLCITDLEFDQMNPFDATASVNKWILPEFVLQGFVCLLFLVTGHWFMFLLAAPLTCYHFMLFWKRDHLIDVTEVFRNLNYEKKYRAIKLGIYLAFFAVLIFRIAAGILAIFRPDGLDYRSSFLIF